MRKLIGMALLSGLGACSWIFMEHVDSSYDGSHEPRCTASRGWALIDGLELAGDVAGIAIETTMKNPDGGGIAVAAIDGGIALASMLTGLHWASECREARDLYDNNGNPAVYGNPGEDSPEAKELRRERARQLAKQRVVPADAGADAAVDDAAADGSE